MASPSSESKELDQEADELPEDDSDVDLVEEDRMAEDIAGEVAGELLEEKEAEDSEPEPEPDFEDVPVLLPEMVKHLV